MKKTSIEWVVNADGTQGFTSNPIRGRCLHACPYCYAERIRKRFKQTGDLTFHNEELEAIKRRKQPTTIFMGSAYDIFGAWVPEQMIQEIINTTMACAQHTFIFLTKNPGRYREFMFPDHCWLGYSDDGTEDMRHYAKFKGIHNNFVSYEPLIGWKASYHPGVIDAVIIGAQTGPGAVPPDREMLDMLILSASHKPVFLKNNLLKIYPDLPRRQEVPWHKERQKW